jgi:phospholipase/lecithinase/hemolysin
MFAADGGFMDANEGTYFQADNVHPTQTGASYLVGLFLSALDAAKPGSARSRNFRARGWGVR